MIKIKVEDIQAMNNTVVLDIDDLPVIKHGVIQPTKKGGHHTKVNYEGVITNVGSTASKDYVVGDRAVINQFAGSHISAGKDKFIKCMPCTDIYITYTGDMLTIQNSVVHQERIVVELLDKSSISESGVFEGDVNMRDPREVDMETGRVLKINPNVTLDVAIGDIVAFELHCGSPFEDGEGKEYKSIHELDVKFKV